MNKPDKPLFNRILAASVFAVVLGIGLAMDDAKPAPAAKGAPYPLATCPVTGNPVSDPPTIVIMECPEDPLNDGREVRLCCPGCIGTFKADTAKYLEVADAAILAQQKDLYPMTTCLVMPDDVLPKAGEPDFDKIKEVVVLNQPVRLCCKGCMKKLKKDPLGYLAKLDEATKAAQRKDYPLKTCPISGEELDADAVEIVLAGRLVKVSCGNCAKKARENPLPVLAKLDAASKAKSAAPAAPAAPATK